ncbi:hypothetical protein CMK12_00705 [Candidatus Poribacteria bacterium]|jgi:hypothetical protein|nr:hypothetical protein [Candidatus Poribacteria bacterium]MDP6597741.1 cohesin domain-containing protein [Candidatus Poribacteria bacterium]MDP6747692.1 cohesin domain-containing protein [Candidatus Poribacteria bacterium]MDP6996203.1 cohesin domain-containing protein [Candidatus Poribacteria bacterium]
MITRYFSLFFTMLTVFSFLLVGTGCERDYNREARTTQPTEMSSVQVMLSPSLFSGSLPFQNLEVVVEVLMLDRYSEEISFDPPIIDAFSLKIGQSRITKLKVPMGTKRVIDIKGYEFGDLVLSGRQVINYLGDELAVADITLDPVDLPLMSISSPQATYNVGDEVAVSINLKNVTDLFGVALELEYNRSRFFPLDVEVHPDSKFAKSGLPVFHDLNLDSRPGKMQIALTLTKGQKPIAIDRKGRSIAIAKFRAVKAGTSNIRVKSLIGTTPVLTKADGQQLDDLNGMRQYLNPPDGREPRGVIQFLVK